MNDCEVQEGRRRAMRGRILILGAVLLLAVARRRRQMAGTHGTCEAGAHFAALGRGWHGHDRLAEPTTA